MARRFTVEEANALLPSIIPRLETLRTLTQRLVAIREELESISPGARLNGGASRLLQLEQEAVMRSQEAEAVLKRLADDGVEVKDPLQGLIDFRSLRDGREVYLCWRLGEGRLAYWHELNTGFQGRRPL